MKNKFLLFFIVIMMVFNVKAITLEACTTEKMNALKEIANKMEFNYTYVMKENDGIKYPEFTINVSNMNKEIKVLIINDFYSLDYKEFVNKDGKSSMSGFKQGEKVVITSKAYTPDKCSTNTVLTKTIKLPYYNQYYEEDFCLENPNFKYCEEFTDTDLSYEKYYKEKEKYLSDKEKLEEKDEKQSKSNIILIISIIGGIVVVGGAVVFIIVRRKKNEL